MFPRHGHDQLVVEEFRLADGASRAEVDDSFAAAYPAGVPLLTSIADDRDVVSVHPIGSGDAADTAAIDHASLGALVSGWEPRRRYDLRIAEHSLVAPTHYRLAVTESGLNDGDRTPPGAPKPPALPKHSATTTVGLLWIGAPVGTHTGLLVLVGDDEEPSAGPDTEWPLPLSEQLGVRIYRGRARD